MPSNVSTEVIPMLIDMNFGQPPRRPNLG